MFTKLIKAPILLGPTITSVLEPNENVLFAPYYLFCRNNVWIKKIIINNFSMLIELINCNKINVSLHFAHFLFHISMLCSLLCKNINKLTACFVYLWNHSLSRLAPRVVTMILWLHRAFQRWNYLFHLSACRQNSSLVHCFFIMLLKRMMSTFFS